ncbi:MAG: CheY-like chemotaxis protein, partial [Planctomycetota bacterium]
MDPSLLLLLLLLVLSGTSVIVIVARRRETRAQQAIERLETELERVERLARRLEREHDEEYLRRVRAESRLDRVLTSVEQAGLHAPGLDGDAKEVFSPVKPERHQPRQPYAQAPRPTSPSKQVAPTQKPAPIPDSTASRPQSPSQPVMQPVPAEPSDAEAQGKLLEGKTIMLAEDGEDTQRLVDFLLRAQGATVITVSDGYTAVEVAFQAESRNEAFDMILMDRGLPKINGLEAASNLVGGHYSGPIVMLSASNRLEDQRAAYEVGCHGFISKPLEPASFAKLVAHEVELATDPKAREQRAAASREIASRPTLPFEQPVAALPSKAAPASAAAKPPMPVAAKPPTAATAKQPVAATVVDPIYSEYASDEMMAELVAQFV